MQAILSWLKRFLKKLAVHILSGISAAIVSFLAILPFLFFFKWLIGPVSRPHGTLPSLVDGWYVWGLIIVWFVLFWKLEPRLHQWMKQRFGLRQEAGLKQSNNDS